MITLLFGLLGSGKSTVGQLLAKQTGARFIEMDTLIADTLGVKSPNEVSSVLWKECQLEICKDLSVQENIVVATSGNIVENDLNILYFQHHSTQLRIIYLKATLESLVSRTLLEKEDTRQHLEEYFSLTLKNREPLYMLYADAVFPNDTKTPQQVVNDIRKFYS